MQLQSSNLKLEEKPVEIAPAKAVQNWLIAQLTEQLSLNAQTIDVSESLTRYGLDSIDAVTLVGDLEDWLDLELPSTLFWDYPTIEKSAQYLVENFDISSALSHPQTETATTTSKVTAGNEATDKKGWGNLFGRLSG
jgi:acyl carrier protein